jgi:hypothetical protein
MPTKLRGRAVMEKPEALTVFIGRLCGAAEIWVDADVPRIEQPFWDVEAVPVSLAPAAELIREDIGLWSQL